MTILFYKTNDPFGYFNNFYPSKMYIYDRWWNNVETAYQAQKTINSIEYLSICEAKTAREACTLGRKVSIRSDWDLIKDRIMFECVMAKFLQNQYLIEKLMETGDEELIENSPIDFYWGCGSDGTGQNKLGKTLMEIRNKLK